MIRLTRLLTLTLALLVAATSQHMAVARAAMAEGGAQVVLCTGDGAVTLTLDATGNPVEPVHFCPDCALTLIGHIAGPGPVTPQPVHLQTLVQRPVLQLNSGTGVLGPLARAPPLTV